MGLSPHRPTVERASLGARLQRLRYVWTWRLRYWWLDTQGGAEARVVLCCLSALVVVAQIAYAAVALLRPQPQAPRQAVVWWVVYIIVALVAAAISYALRPKPETPKPQEGEGPTTEDGQAVIRYWGTHWIGDEFLLAWKVVGRDKIKAKGGK